MHELSLIKDLLAKIEAVAARAHATRIKTVSVWLGALAHISPEHFREHFEDGTRGTRVEGATLEIETSTDQTHPRAQDILLRKIEVEDAS